MTQAALALAFGAVATAPAADGGASTGASAARIYAAFALFGAWRAVGFSSVMLSARLLFPSHVDGLGFAVGLAWSLGGVVSLSAGHASVRAVHTDVRWFRPVLLTFAAVAVAAAVSFAVALRCCQGSTAAEEEQRHAPKSSNGSAGEGAERTPLLVNDNSAPTLSSE